MGCETGPRGLGRDGGVRFDGFERRECVTTRKNTHRGATFTASVALSEETSGYGTLFAGVPTIFLNDDDGKVLPLAKNDSWRATLVADHVSREWLLKVRYREGPRPRFFATHEEGLAPEPAVLKGDVALRALSVLLPHVNADGASARRVREAVTVIEASSGIEQLIYQASTHRKVAETRTTSSALTCLPASIRLALEMVLHDDAEQRALDGQLAELEQRWREAEQIASIADALLVSSDTNKRFELLRRTHRTER